MCVGETEVPDVDAEIRGTVAWVPDDVNCFSLASISSVSEDGFRVTLDGEDDETIAEVG